MRHVDLDHLEARLLGPARGVAEGPDDGADVVGRELARHGVPLGEGQGAGPDRRPAAATLHHGPAAAPGRLGRGLASGVRELDRGSGPLLGDEACGGSPRHRVRVGPQARVVGADPALGKDGARLGDDEPGAAHRAAPEVDEVPRVRQAVARRVLAHRRDGDAVAQRRLAQPQGREEGAHCAMLHPRPDGGHARCFQPTSGFRTLSSGNRLKSRSALQSSPTPCRRHSAAIRASCTRGPSMRPSRRSGFRLCQ